MAEATATGKRAMLEWVGTMSVSGAVAVYAIGFVTTAIYLTRFGVPTAEFLRPQYIGAGL